MHAQLDSDLASVLSTVFIPLQAGLKPMATAVLFLQVSQVPSQLGTLPDLASRTTSVGN